MGTPLPTESSASNRKRAALAILPFLVLGLFNLGLILWWGVEPLWGFAILPPILFISVLGWIGFKSGFITEHSEHSEREERGVDDPDDRADGANRWG